MPSTKDKILEASIKLFSERGYSDVSMREIAAAVGIKASSIYNHFPSKRDILKNIYDFYATQQKLTSPSLETLLLLAETEHPLDVLAKLDYRYTPEIQTVIERILIIASQEICTNPDSENFALKYLFEFPLKTFAPLLNRMIELGKIEPIDVDSFCSVLVYYTFSIAVLNGTSMRTNVEKYSSGLSMIFSLIKPTQKSSAGDGLVSHNAAPCSCDQNQSCGSVN